MTTVLLVVAGGVGALLRGEVAAREGTRRGTAIVNLAGAFLLGLVVGLVGGPDSGSGRLAVAGGLFGGFTTFSTWMLDNDVRAREDQPMALTVTLVVGVLAAAVGWFLGALAR